MSHDRAEALADQVTQLRRELSLAEEGLANYAQENERLRMRCTVLASLLYYDGQPIPREAVPGDFGLHP